MLLSRYEADPFDGEVWRANPITNTLGPGLSQRQRMVQDLLRGDELRRGRRKEDVLDLLGPPNQEATGHSETWPPWHDRAEARLLYFLGNDRGALGDKQWLLIDLDEGGQVLHAQLHTGGP